MSIIMGCGDFLFRFDRMDEYCLLEMVAAFGIVLFCMLPVILEVED